MLTGKHALILLVTELKNKQNILKEFLFKLDITAPVVTLLLAIVFQKIRRRSFSFPDYVLLTFLLLELVFNTVSAILQYEAVSNLTIYFFNCIAIHVLFAFYFYKLLDTKWFVYSGFIAFCVLSTIIICVIQPYNSFPSYIYSLSAFIIVVYSLLFLLQMLNAPPILEILTLKEFWIVSGILIYFGSVFFIFISYNYLSVTAPRTVYVLWQLHNVFLSFGCIGFLKALNSSKWILK